MSTNQPLKTYFETEMIEMDDVTLDFMKGQLAASKYRDDDGEYEGMRIDIAGPYCQMNPEGPPRFLFSPSNRIGYEDEASFLPYDATDAAIEAWLIDWKGTLATNAEEAAEVYENESEFDRERRLSRDAQLGY